MKHLRRTLAILGVVLVLLLGLAAVVLGTEPGLRWVLSAGARASGGALSVAAASGRLLGPLTLQGVSYERPGLEVHAVQARLEWQPGALLHGTLHVVALQLQGVEVHTGGAGDTSSGPLTLPDVVLPLAVVLDGAELKDLRIVPAGRAPVAIGRLALQARADASGLHIQSLEAQAAEGSARLHGELRPQGRYPLRLDVSWTARVPDLTAPLAGETRLSGDLDSLEIEQRLSQPAQAKLTGTVRQLLGALQWQADLYLPELHSAALDAELPPMSLAGEVHARGDLKGLQASAKLDGETPWTGNLHLAIKSALRDGVLHIPALRLTQPGDGAAVELHGRLTPGGDDWQAEVSWRRLGWPLQGSAALRSPTGSAHLEGSPHAYQARLEAQLEGKDLPAGRWSVEGAGDLRKFTVRRLLVQTLKGSVDGKGEVGWHGGIQWRLTLQGTNLDPAAQWQDWPGKLGFAVTSTGTLRDGGLAGQVELARLDGELRGYPVAAQGSATSAGGEFSIPGLDLRSGSAHLHAAGSLAQSWRLGWQADIPDLGHLLPDAGGTLSGEGSIGGLRAAPEIRARLAGSGLHAGAARVDGLTLDAAVDVSDQQGSTLKATAHGLRYQALEVSQATLSLGGRASDHTLQVRLQGPGEQLLVDAAGAYGSGQWKGRLTQATLATPQTGRWSLEHPVDIAAGATAANLPETCWSSTPARLCLQGDWNPDHGARGRLRLSNLDVGRWKAAMPEGLKLETRLGADLQAEAPPAAPLRLRARLEAAPGRATYRLADDRQVRASFDQVALQATTEGGKLVAKGGLRLSEGGKLDADVELPWPLGKADGPLRGGLQANLKELGLLPTLLPGVEDTQGEVAVALNLGGTLRAPKLDGQASLEHGQASVPRLGLDLQELRLNATSRNGDTLVVDASAKSGAGTVKLNGEVALKPDQGWPYRLDLKGSDFQVINIPEAVALASPDLALKGDRRASTVSGEIRVPSATITLKDLSQTVQVSDDAVIVDARQPQAPAQPPLALSADLRLSLGDKVRFDGFGLGARLGGSVRVQVRPQTLPLATGELRVEDGQYRAYGQDLQIDRGRLIYGGTPLTDPGLDVRALRHLQDVAAGVQVRGTLSHPQLTLYSEPAMAQKDILSYMLTGRPLSQASASDGRLLASAAASLGAAGGAGLASQIARTFNLDEVRFESGDAQSGTSLLIGKQLSPRLYLSYGQALSEPTSLIKMRYLLSSKWVLETESGTQSSADVLYTIELR